MARLAMQQAKHVKFTGLDLTYEAATTPGSPVMMSIDPDTIKRAVGSINKIDSELEKLALYRMLQKENYTVDWISGRKEFAIAEALRDFTSLISQLQPMSHNSCRIMASAMARAVEKSVGLAVPDRSQGR